MVMAKTYILTVAVELLLFQYYQKLVFKKAEEFGNIQKIVVKNAD
jgi:hypothetical protein